MLAAYRAFAVSFRKVPLGPRKLSMPGESIAKGARFRERNLRQETLSLRTSPFFVWKKEDSEGRILFAAKRLSSPRKVSLSA